MCFILFVTKILSEQKEESLEKEVDESKERLRDLEDKLKNSENRFYDNLGTGQRLKSKPIIEESDNDSEKSQVDTEDSDHLFSADPLFRANQFEPSNPGSQPRLVPSSSNKRVRLLGYALNVIPLSLTIFTRYQFVYPFIISLISFYSRRAIGKMLLHLPLHLWRILLVNR